MSSLVSMGVGRPRSRLKPRSLRLPLPPLMKLEVTSVWLQGTLWEENLILVPFEVGTDQIQLHGSVEDYSLGASAEQTDTAIIHNETQQVVGWIVGISRSELIGSSAFAFVSNYEGPPAPPPNPLKNGETLRSPWQRPDRNSDRTQDRHSYFRCDGSPIDCCLRYLCVVSTWRISNE